MYRVTKHFEVPVSHRLSKHAGNCQFIHGHNLNIEVTVASDHLNDNDMIIDFADLKRLVKKYLNIFDHAFLANEDDKDLAKKEPYLFERAKFFEFDPTAERLCKYIYDCLNKDVDTIKTIAQNNLAIESVAIWENSGSRAEYSGLWKLEDYL